MQLRRVFFVFYFFVASDNRDVHVKIILIIIATQSSMEPALQCALECCAPFDSTIRKQGLRAEKILTMAALVIFGLTETYCLKIKLNANLDKLIQQFV